MGVEGVGLTGLGNFLTGWLFKPPSAAAPESGFPVWRTLSIKPAGPWCRAVQPYHMGVTQTGRICGNCGNMA